MLIVIELCVIMLIVIKFSVIMLNVIALIVIKLSVIILGVIMLSVEVSLCSFLTVYTMKTFWYDNLDSLALFH
jgi:hypothetical protein